MNFAAFGLHHRRAAILFTAILAVAGALAYGKLPKAIFPNMAYSSIEVTVNRGDTPAKQMDLQFSRPLQAALAVVPGIRRVQATSSQGSVDIVANFNENTSANRDLQYITQAIAALSGSFPVDAQIGAKIVALNYEPVVSYALRAPNVSRTVLAEELQRQSLAIFTGIPGLARVLVVGARPREYAVDIDPLKLAARSVSIADVESAIAGSTTVTAVGHGSARYQRVIAQVNPGVHGVRALSAISVASRAGEPVRLADLAHVHLAVAPRSGDATSMGKRAVVMNAYAQPNADLVRMADAFTHKLPALMAALPAGTTIRKYWDQTTLIRNSQATLRDSIVIGALLAVLVIFFFLGRWQITAIAALIIPLAMLTALLFMELANETINVMSAGGLAVAVGLIIDDAIVVVENIQRHLQMGKAKAQAIVDASGQISLAMIASTTTTIIVFVPLAFTTGVSGAFFRALAITLSASLVASLVLALIVAPILAERFLPAGAGETKQNALVERLLELYEPLLRGALAKPWKAYIVAGLALLVTVFGMLRLPSDFLPKMDEGAFELAYVLPPGTSLAETTRVVVGIERIVAATPSVQAEGNVVGIDTNGFSPLPQNQGFLRVTLQPIGRRPPIGTVIASLRDRVTAAYPNVQMDFHQVLNDMIYSLSNAHAPVEVTVAGPQQAALVAIAPKIARAMSAVRGLHGVFDGVTVENRALDIQPRLGLPGGIGLRPADLAAALTAAVRGSIVANISSPPNVVPVRVRYDRAWRVSPDRLAEIPVVGSSGQIASLASLARLGTAPVQTDIYEVNGQPQIVATADFSGNLSSVIGRLRRALNGVAVSPGYSVSIGGAFTAQKQSFGQFATVAVIGIALVFLVMVFTFRSYRAPLVILLAIPLALVGVVLALLITRTPFNVSSFMGLILLVGIVVKNGILLLDAARKELESGVSVDEALVAAGRVRLRPIVMTTLAAIAGLLPLALGLGAGAEMERALAIAVIGGLSTATIFTLGIIPTFYATMMRRSSD